MEDKNLEIQKTYPYEQRTEEDTNQSQNESVSNNQTESSKNVANQERDGATTEEINQVSPSTQYEGAVNQARLTKPFTDYRERLLEMWSELPDELDKQQKAVVNAIYQVFKYNMKLPPPMIRSLINDIETPKPQKYGSQDFGVLANDPLFKIYLVCRVMSMNYGKRKTVYFVGGANAGLS